MKCLAKRKSNTGLRNSYIIQELELVFATSYFQNCNISPSVLLVSFHLVYISSGKFLTIFAAKTMYVQIVNFSHFWYMSRPSLLIKFLLLTPWCRVLEKLTGLQLVKKFPTFHGTRRFITALTSFRHLSVSWASPVQFIYPHPTFWRSIIILSTHLRLGLPSGFL